MLEPTNANSYQNGVPSFEAAKEILGITESADGSVMDPSLRTHVAGQLRDKANVAKELRKYHEVMDDKKGNKGKGNKDKGKGENKENS